MARLVYVNTVEIGSSDLPTEIVEEIYYTPQFSFFKVEYRGDLPFDTIYVALHNDDLYENIKSKSLIYLFRGEERISVYDNFEDEYTIPTSDFKSHKVRINTIRAVNSYIKKQRQDVINTYDMLRANEYYDFKSMVG